MNVLHEARNTCEETDLKLWGVVSCGAGVPQEKRAEEGPKESKAEEEIAEEESKKKERKKKIKLGQK